MKNFIVIVLDGVGIGELPDAEKYNDKGSDTLGNMADKLGGLSLPNLTLLGLGNIKPIKGLQSQKFPLASYGKMAEVSIGKDSTTGHWELGGLKVDKEFPLFPNGFPKNIIDKFISETKVGGILGNKAASGTEIIKELGEEHLKTSYPIVYTSADSVFQIAAHEEVIPLQRLYEICSIARKKVLVDENAVGRVIARPFVGKPGSFTRTTNRKDFSLDPFSPTILDYLYDAGIQTIGIGKVNDLFNYRGIAKQEKTKSNAEGIQKIIDNTKKENNSFIFANLVDFDVYYGHRLDPEGFYRALQEFDNHLQTILDILDDSDKLIITADHGNDPTSTSTDHSREYVPLLYFQKGVPGKNLGTRKTFSDVAQTVAHFFKINNNLMGESFLEI
ncbi:phosphopentomutase [Melioribacteraceae bacterium 4301-Me]|uniref:phosphopentomutase n=1 Tax=Pyranulibacter aquaticus TaxID=3163344 RepID=UPI0035960861